MKVVYTVLIVLIMLFVITFSLQNQTDVVIQYYDLVPKVAVAVYMLIFISSWGVVFTCSGVFERSSSPERSPGSTIRPGASAEIRASYAPPVIEEGTRRKAVDSYQIEINKGTISICPFLLATADLFR